MREHQQSRPAGAVIEAVDDVDAGDHPSPGMVWMTEPDGACSYLSESWYAFTGQTPETGLGFGWLDALHPEDREAAGRAFAAANEQRAPFRSDYRLRRRDGAYHWTIDSAAPRFGDDGAFLGYVGSVIDITDRKRAEEALAEREARFRALFSSIDEGYCLCEMILDDAGQPVDYRFLEANPLFAAMTGLVDAVGRTAYELVPNLERTWLETYAGVALGGEPLRFEQGSDAMGRWFDVFATPVAPRGRFALVFKDVTARRRAEAALREREAAERRARGQAELLAELGTTLEAVDGLEACARRLVELLVPRVADVAVVEVPGEEEPVVARAGAWDFPLETLPAGARIRVALPLRPGLRGELQLGLAGQARRRYDRDDRAFARRVAAHAGVVLERSRLREAEHEIALRLQRALLPDRVLRHPALEIAARYEAASGVLSVGGDWYDTFALPGGRVGLAVGDVVGHGLEAAAAMGRLRTALAALAPHADGPGRLLALLNEFAAGPNGSDFVTACCATLDPATGALRYASAGHPPMLLVAPGGATRWLGAAASPPLRFGLVSERPEASAVLEPGAALVLYSDGLVERRREPIDAGLARLERAARAGHADPAEALCDRIVAALGVDAARDDDVVVLCVRRTGRER